nr:hypothetical protein [Tanacetum cinerariifolium]
MLERGSYIPWASRFRRYLNRKRENRKCLNKAIDEGPYEFRIFIPSDTEAPRMQKEEDLRGDDLKHYEAEIEAKNLILIAIPNDIYKSADACTTAKSMLQIVECLMRGICKTRLTGNYVTQVRLVKRLTLDSYDDLLDYLEKLVNASRAKKLKKSHDLLALVAHTVQNNSDDPLTSVMILLACAITRNFSNPKNNRLRTSSNTRNQAIVQGTAANVQCYNCSEKGHYARNYLKPKVWDSKDTEDILEDATKSQMKMKNKLKDLIAIEKKQNVCIIDYKKLNALYEDFVPQKELYAEQKYFPSFISSENLSNASSLYSSS